MKSQSIILLLFPLTLALIPNNNQQNQELKKREITEYDLINFIVNSCSADRIDSIIENLCDQTIQSALMGNFPSLIYYCRVLGIEQRYCHSVNEQTSHIDVQTPNGSPSSRHYRKLQKKLQKKTLMKKNDRDLETEMIFEICLNNDEKISIEINHLCNETLLLIEEGKYSTMKHLCKSHDDSSFCRSVNALNSMKTDQEKRRRRRRNLPSSSMINDNENPLRID